MGLKNRLVFCESLFLCLQKLLPIIRGKDFQSPHRGEISIEFNNPFKKGAEKPNLKDFEKHIAPKPTELYMKK